MGTKVFSFWVGARLRLIDWVCVCSWLRAGLDVTIYSHNADLRVPKGVILADAGEILTPNILDIMTPLRRTKAAINHRNVSYADLFRLKGISLGCGVWMDSDVYVFEDFEPDLTKPYLLWEGFRRTGVSILYFPADSPLLVSYLAWLDGDLEAVPEWVEWRKRCYWPLVWRMKGLAYRPMDLGITIFGNYAITRLIQRHRMGRDVSPKHLFYHWTASQTEQFFTHMKGEETLRAAGAKGLHVHRKALSRQPAMPGSLFAKAIDLAEPYPA